MKILLVSPSLRCGGSERVVSLLSQELSNNHPVYLALFNSREIAYPYSAQLIDLDFPAQKNLFGKLPIFIKRIFRLIQLINKIQPDLIISFMESANFPTICAAFFCGILSKTKISIHSNPKFFPIYQKLGIFLAYRFPQRVIAVSRGIADELKSYYLPLSKITTIPNPLSLEQVAKLQEQEPQIAKSLPSKFILGVGRLHYAKGFDRLITAFSRLEDLSLDLVILGSGDEFDHLTKLAQNLGVAERTHFYGNVENPFPFYRKAFCLVSSSRYEGFSMVILEAFACGCPVISFDCDFGPSELIQNGINGILVKEGDIEELTNSIRLLIQNPLLRETFITNGYEIAKQYDIRSIAHQYLEN
ncbi:MAG: glycosyltransferase family 4 protein [Anaerolineales bacterium]